MLDKETGKGNGINDILNYVISYQKEFIESISLLLLKQREFAIA
jgi:hypothetical protein